MNIPDVVCLSTADWDAELWTNKQHLMSRLADAGARVLYVDSLGLRAPSANAQDAWRIFSRLRGWRPFAYHLKNGLLRDSPLALPFSAGWARAVNSVLLGQRFRRNLKKHHFENPVMWTYTPAAIDLYSDATYSALIYHCVDDLASYPGVDREAFNAREAALVHRADVCIASSRPLLRRLEGMGARRAVYWPNPADVRTIMRAEMPLVPRSHRRRVGFVGAMQEHKVDVQLLLGIATLRPDWDLVLVGPQGLGLGQSSMASVDWPSNVELRGTVHRTALPSVLREFDAALIPYRLNDYTRGVFPMKVFEYLAAGLGVVSTPLPSLLGEVKHVHFASTASETVEALAELMGSDNGQRRAERVDYAKGHSWESRTTQALALLEEATRPSSDVREEVGDPLQRTTFGQARGPAAFGSQ